MEYKKLYDKERRKNTILMTELNFKDDLEKLKKLSKKQSELEEIVDKYKSFLKIEKSVTEFRQIFTVKPISSI